MDSGLEQAVDEIRLSFNDPEIIPDPYPIYRALRTRSPACFLPFLDGTWLFFRYEDVSDLLRDARLTSDRTGLPLRALPADQRAQFDDMVAVLKRWLGMQDQPVHLPMRRHLNRVTESLNGPTIRVRVQPIVDDLVARIPTGQGVDVIAELCRPLPALVISDLLGLSVTDHRQLAAWSDDLAYVFGSSRLELSEVQRAKQSTLALDGYIRAAARRADLPEDSVLYRLLHLRSNGEALTEDDACAQCVLLLFAGLEPTRYAIGNAIYALLGHPEQAAVLRAEPALIDSAVDEFLRYDSPVQWVGRMARESFTFRGCDIRQGHLVLPYVAAANRDPDRFDHPDVLDVRRTDAARHLGFGTGFHHCLGAALVREQMRAALRTILTTFSDFELDPDVALRWNTNLGFHGHRSLTVRFRR